MASWTLRGAAVVGVFIVSFSRAFRDGAECASGVGRDWVPASDELFGARPVCKGGIGAGLASAWRRLGVPGDYPALSRVRCYCQAAAWGGSGSGAEQHQRGCWPAELQAAWAGQARDHARQPGGADISPSAALVRPARAGVAGIGLPEPGLQGAQLRVVQVLAQPVRLLGGQAQRVAGLGRTAGQQLGLGQQSERERAVP